MQGNIALKSWIIHKEDGIVGPLSGFDMDLMYAKGQFSDFTMVSISEQEPLPV